MNNTWASFHNAIKKIKDTLKRNSFLLFLIDKRSILDMINEIQKLIRNVFTNFPTLENISNKFRKIVKSFAKMLILN